MVGNVIAISEAVALGFSRVVLLQVSTPEWLALAAAAVLVFAGLAFLIGRRADMPRCPRCRHALPPHAPMPSGVCSECGASIRSYNDCIKRHRAPVMGSILLCVGLISAGYGVGDGPRTWFLKQVLPRYRVDSTQTNGTLVIRLSSPRWPDDAALPLVEVSRSGRTVFRSTMSYPSAGEVLAATADGDDATRYVWIRSDSGGSGGFSTTYLFQTSNDDEFLPAALLDNGVFVSAAPGSDRSVWRQADLSYRYWITSGAGSPTPTLEAVPREIPGGHQIRFLDPAPNAGPTAEQLGTALDRLRDASANATDSERILSSTLRPFLDLVYAGRAPDAWRFLDDAFDARLAALLESGAVSDLPRSREAFRAVLHEQMQRSPFHQELLRRNGGSIAPRDR